MTHCLLFQPWRLVPLAITLVGISLLQPLQGQKGDGLEQRPQPEIRSGDYRVGPQDLLEYSVLEAPEIRGSLRVSAGGEITLPLAGTVKVAGKTPEEVETALDDALRRSFMKDPHVSVLVHEMESHSVSVVGAVKKPGVFKIAGPKTVLEMISLTEGLAEDAGDTVMVMHGAGFPAEGQPPAAAGNNPEQDSVHQESSAALATNTVAIKLKELLNSTSSQSNVLVYPGDIVKVTRAELVYVLGAVKKPGGFLLRNNENITILQAIALAEGTLPSSARSHVRILRTTPSQERKEIAADVDKITKGKAPDSMLQPNDIVVIPPSGSKTALYRSLELIVSTVPAAAIYRGF